MVIDQAEWSRLQAEGIAACEKRRFPQAEIAFTQALKLIQDNLTPELEPNSGNSRSKIEPDQLNKLDQHNQPDQLNQADQLAEKLAQSLNNLATACQAQGKYSMALEHYSRSADIYKKLHGEESLTYATSLHNLAIANGARREYEKAESIFKQALAIKEKLLGANHPDLQTIANNLAQSLKNAGKPEAANEVKQKYR